MRGGLVAFMGAFCVALLTVSGTSAGKPDKTGKPDKPGGPATEWIAFEGDLEGGEVVEGCCPNDGPFPTYTMTLSTPFGEVSGTHVGQLFMNVMGTGRNQAYKVQFWNSAVFVEVVGGEIDNDKKSKLLTVRFLNERCRVVHANGESEILVSFELTRTRL